MISKSMIMQDYEKFKLCNQLNNVQKHVKQAMVQEVRFNTNKSYTSQQHTLYFSQALSSVEVEQLSLESLCEGLVSGTLHCG